MTAFTGGFLRTNTDCWRQPSCPADLLCSWIFVQRNASLVVETRTLRQEMRVHLPCVGAYPGLSWGTNSKACLRSSRSEGRGSHLSTPGITENKGSKHWTKTTNWGPLILMRPKKKTKTLQIRFVLYSYDFSGLQESGRCKCPHCSQSSFCR